MSDYFYITTRRDIDGQHRIYSGRCYNTPKKDNYERLLGLFDNIKQAECEAKRKNYKQPTICNCRGCLGAIKDELKAPYDTLEEDNLSVRNGTN
ncbi:hypothetical protein [Serratia marcescens]|uniref:hypothetical protein n=1 Tax=Serratia marcescens TaxID=615 RepID=UPI001116B7A5|nr:hypothetical protein [Serratia marcescens]